MDLTVAVVLVAGLVGAGFQLTRLEKALEALHARVIGLERFNEQNRTKLDRLIIQTDHILGGVTDIRSEAEDR